MLYVVGIVEFINPVASDFSETFSYTDNIIKLVLIRLKPLSKHK